MDTTVKELLNWGTNILQEYGIPSSRAECELIMAAILGCKKLDIYLKSDLILGESEQEKYKKLIQRRIQRVPLAYLLKEAEFFGLKLKIDERVLIPRPETELLVEEVLKIVTSHQSPVTSITIVDVGTGSGNIVISLAQNLPQAQILATDISDQALEVAKENAKIHNLYHRIKFYCGDLLASLPSELKGKIDIVVFNPPYLDEKDFDNLQPEIVFEPRQALYGGEDGLDFYRRIIPASLEYLKEKGYLVLEVGIRQAERIEKIFYQTKNFTISKIVKDYNGIDRIIIAQKITPRRRKWIKLLLPGATS